MTNATTGSTPYSLHALRHLRRTIGQNIRDRRTRKKWPLRKLARVSGVSDFMLDHFELGKHNIDLQDLLRIASALDVSVTHLISAS